MNERTRPASHRYLPNHRSHSCRDNVKRKTCSVAAGWLRIRCLSGIASEGHRQTVDSARRRFEQQLAKREDELNEAVRRRRDLSSSAIDKRQATEQLHVLRQSLSQDYAQLIQVRTTLVIPSRIECIFSQVYIGEHKVG